MTATGELGKGEGMEGLSQKEKGLMDMDNSWWLLGGEGYKSTKG